MNDIFTPQFKPKNHHELVLFTLAEHSNTSFELSGLSWLERYRIAKWSTRLGETENMIGKKLCNRHTKTFKNVFGHDSYYTVYIPLFSCSEYTEMFLKLREKESK